MSTEFDAARASFASSAPGRAMHRITESIVAAWRSSSIRFAIQRVQAQLPMSPAERVRTAAIAVAVGTVVQAVMVFMMPASVKPLALPMFDAALTTLAAVIAWRADAIVAAWPSSWLTRMTRR